VGLMPILFERSTQAQFLIPMVLSLSFGILLSSVVTLLLVPCTYLGGYNVGNALTQFIQPRAKKIGLLLSAHAVKDNSSGP
jgi:hypothetical protein